MDADASRVALASRERLAARASLGSHLGIAYDDLSGRPPWWEWFERLSEEQRFAAGGTLSLVSE